MNSSLALAASELGPKKYQPS